MARKFLASLSGFFKKISERLNSVSNLQDSGAGVYSITNLKSGKKFIGHSFELSKEEEIQRFMLRRNMHRNGELQGEYDTLGSDSFGYEIERIALVQPDQAVTLWNLMEMASDVRLWNLMEMASDVRASYVEDGTELYNKIKTVNIRTETYLDLRKGRRKK
jgi:hypothetical protein